MKKTFYAVLLASFSALSINAALVGSAPLDEDGGGEVDGLSLFEYVTQYKDGGIFGKGEPANGTGEWVLGWENPIKSKDDWSFSFHSFVGLGETSNGSGTSLIGTGDEYWADPTLDFEQGFQFYLDKEGSLLVNIKSSSTNISGYDAGSWQHIGLSHSNGELSIYINGSLQNTIKTTYGDSDSLKSLTSIGATENMGVKDVTVWDNALNAEEMQKLSGRTPSDVVPEPSTAALGLVGIGLLLFKRRRN